LGPLFRISGNELWLSAVMGAFVGWHGVVFSFATGLMIWLVLTPVRAWLGRHGRCLTWGALTGLSALVYLLASRWVLMRALG
jgi:hypothetical protein